MPHMGGLASLNNVGGSLDPRGMLKGAWNSILKKDYAPVFEPALTVLEVLQSGTADAAIKRMADCANRVADSLSELGYDHSGPLYHRILGTAKSDGAFYTHNVSALMLARLALTEDYLNWKDPGAVGNLRIMDPACGTGTLLMAVLHTIKARTGYDGMDGAARSDLHRMLVEDVLCGLDINRYGVQLAACNLTLGAPTVDYKRMNLLTMQHGPQPGGAVKAGSVEMLRATSGGTTMQEYVRPLRSMGDLKAARVDDTKTGSFQLEDIGLVIMNPPFTDNAKRGRKFDDATVKKMQDNEKSIAAELKHRNPEAAGVVNFNSISTFFTPLADRLLHAEYGTLARVLPTTACTNASGVAERKFLAKMFHVERIVANHDPKKFNFSHGTSIHECLMVCRRHNGGERPPTEFVSLRKRPRTPGEAIRVADAIARGDGASGSMCIWPAERVMRGDWTPVQWYDNRLAELVHDIESSRLLEPAGGGGGRYTFGPAGRRIYDAYEQCSEGDADAVRIFHSVSSKLRRTMRAAPESWHRPKPDKEKLAAKYWKQGSNLLVAARLDTLNGRLLSLYSDEATVGSGWIPVNVKREYAAKALAAWWNSTPVWLMLLNRRGKKLTYPKWSLKHLQEIRIPKQDNPGWGALYEAYGRVCDRELLPMHVSDDPVRAIIDAAAARVLDMQPEELADWRRRLSEEPTVCGS